MFRGLGACPRKILQNMTSILDDLVHFGWGYACCIELYPRPGGAEHSLAPPSFDFPPEFQGGAKRHSCPPSSEQGGQLPPLPPRFLRHCVTSVSCFKRHLSAADVVVPPYFYEGNREAQIIHCKLRLSISDLNYHLFLRHLTESKSCSCGAEIEDTQHYLFHCSLFDNVRPMTILGPNSKFTLQDLLNGNPTLTIAENRNVFQAVQKFIIDSGRFASKWMPWLCLFLTASYPTVRKHYNKTAFFFSLLFFSFRL